MNLKTVKFEDLSLALKAAVIGGWIIAFLVLFYIISFVAGLLYGFATGV